MSLNKFTSTQTGVDLGLEIGCDELKANIIDVATATLNNLTVNETSFDGVDGNANDVLTTNGAGLLELKPLPTGQILVSKDVIGLGAYAFGVDEGAGSIVDISSLYEENGKFIKIYGTVRVDNIRSESWDPSTSTTRFVFDITIPDTIAYPVKTGFFNVSLFGGGTGYAEDGAFLDTAVVHISHNTGVNNKISVEYDFKNDLRIDSNRYGYLSWWVFYEKV